jgi:LmbE family N-acetylglucosaminyl deacetylase
MAGARSEIPDAFADTDREQAARRLAALLQEERADVLTIYDPAGGYGHPDHVQAHHVGTRAAQLAGTPVVLEATVDRRALLRILRAVWWLPGVPREFRPASFATAFAEPGRLTHRVDVRKFIAHKRAAMAAHTSQASADTGRRTLAILLKLPGPLFRAVLGHEWYVEHGRAPTRPLADDIFCGLLDKR